MTPELEMILAEGAGIQPGYSSAKVLEKCNRCRLGQIALAGRTSYLLTQSRIIFNQGSPLEKFGDGKYEDLFVTALRNHGMLCIGLYR